MRRIPFVLGVYGFTFSIFLTGFIYGTFFVKDICELQPHQKQKIGNGKKKNFFVDFYDFKQVGKTLKIVFKRGDGCRRTKMCLILMLGLLVLAPISGKKVNIKHFVIQNFKVCLLRFRVGNNLPLHVFEDW